MTNTPDSRFEFEPAGPTRVQETRQDSPSSALLHWIFRGHQGMRAGWSVLIFIAIFATLGLGAGALARTISHTERSLTEIPAPSILREALQLAALFLATWIMAGIEKRSVLCYGFADKRKLIRLASGSVVGFLVISGLVGLLWATHVLAFDGRILSGEMIWKYGLLWGVMFFIVAFFEEGLLRGYLQYTLARGLNFWSAAAILSVLFGALHTNNWRESPVGIVAAIAADLVFCLSLRLTGSLWWIVGVHAGWDWAESYFYGVADSGVETQGHLYATHAIGRQVWSGGATGPEGSVYALLVLLLLAIGIWLMWGNGRHPLGT